MLFALQWKKINISWGLLVEDSNSMANMRSKDERTQRTVASEAARLTQEHHLQKSKTYPNGMVLEFR